MNLALEQIVRTGANKNLLKFPNTIAAYSNYGKYLWITLKQKDKDICVTTWKLSEIPDIHLYKEDAESSEYPMPPFEQEDIKLKDIFTKNLVVPKDFTPIKFISVPVPYGLNSYKAPMPKAQYEVYFQQMFNNEAHASYKRHWLWGAFSRKIKHKTKHRDYLVRAMMYQEINEIIRQANYEEKYYRTQYSYVYDCWSNLFETLFIYDNNPAGELVFATSPMHCF